MEYSVTFFDYPHIHHEFIGERTWNGKIIKYLFKSMETIKPNPETEKRKYIYRDNSTREHKIIFECEANDILEADELYEQIIGADPRTQNHVGCSIEFKR